MFAILNSGSAILLLLISMSLVHAGEVAGDPAEIAIGERLFLETRFAQFFNARGKGGDPVMDVTETVDGHLPGPFIGQSMNCAACHLVDQQLESSNGGMRSYSDFARRSPIPQREDGKTHAVRNSPPLVNASLARRDRSLFHFDAEFSSLHDLVKDTYTGRNYGWLPGERLQAIRHFVAIIRQDDGSGELAKEFGGAYRIILKGTDPSIPDEFRLSEEFRIDVDTASDEEIFDHVSLLTVAYVEDLQFSRNKEGLFNGSPYDLFLKKNGLPQQPRKGESPVAYSQRLLRALKCLKSPRFVRSEEGGFAFHEQPFVFGPTELKGMRLFFARHSKHSRRKSGNCIACHAAPNFTDFSLHNTGITQFEYNSIHGEGAFETLFIPSLRERNNNHSAWLPATEMHPDAQEPFRAIPDATRPGLTDLGVWNVFANPDFAAPQKKLRRLLCAEQRQNIPERQGVGRHKWRDQTSCRQSTLLRRSIASFKTPGLRDLGHSAPYMHNGQLDTIEEVVKFYIDTSKQARNGRLRNPAPALHGIRLDKDDIKPIAAFLRALNEDYE